MSEKMKVYIDEEMFLNIHKFAIFITYYIEYVVLFFLIIFLWILNLLQRKVNSIKYLKVSIFFITVLWSLFLIWFDKDHYKFCKKNTNVKDECYNVYLFESIVREINDFGSKILYFIYTEVIIILKYFLIVVPSGELLSGILYFVGTYCGVVTISIIMVVFGIIFYMALFECFMEYCFLF